jgi:hypothetical protein
MLRERVVRMLAVAAAAAAARVGMTAANKKNKKKLFSDNETRPFVRWCVSKRKIWFVIDRLVSCLAEPRNKVATQSLLIISHATISLERC